MRLPRFHLQGGYSDRDECIPASRPRSTASVDSASAQRMRGAACAGFATGCVVFSASAGLSRGGGCEPDCSDKLLTRVATMATIPTTKTMAHGASIHPRLASRNGNGAPLSLDPLARALALSLRFFRHAALPLNLRGSFQRALKQRLTSRSPLVKLSAIHCRGSGEACPGNTQVTISQIFGRSFKIT
jgi:hypothetical protein